jgi:hypothetical protein
MTNPLPRDNAFGAAQRIEMQMIESGAAGARFYGCPRRPKG